LTNKHLIRTTAASSIGTLFEWYDFLIFGTAAALVFNKIFFPNIDPWLGTLAAISTYMVGFFARPLGGAVFGHLSDKYGRKSTLMTTMMIMGIGTFAIGLLPTYQSIGIWAPIMLVLLRVVQGIGFGGEWSSATLMVLENAPENRKGFYSSFVQIGFPLGSLLATGSFALLAATLSNEELLSWGWRIPFLASLILLAIGGYVRSNLTETPEFARRKIDGTTSRHPFKDLITKQPRELLLAVGVKISEVSWSYILMVFTVSYVTTKLALPKSSVLNALTIAAAINLVSIPFFGYLSDIVGRQKIFYAGALFTIGMAFPLFWLINNQMIALAVICGLVFGNAMMFSAIPAFMADMFEGPTKSTGMSFANQLASMIGGGLSPLMMIALSEHFGGTIGASVLMAAYGVITLVCTMVAWRIISSRHQKTC
jgi:MHS family shikimate/dehydroshikimate transporter-like MFS transporter